MRKVKKHQGFHRCEILTEQFYSMAGGSLLGQIFLNASLQWCYTDRDKISCGTIIWFISLYQPLLNPTGNCAYSTFSQFFKCLLCLCPTLRMWLCTHDTEVLKNMFSGSYSVIHRYNAFSVWKMKAFYLWNWSYNWSYCTCEQLLEYDRAECLRNTSTVNGFSRTGAVCSLSHT